MDKKTVEHIANLAKLKITENEVQIYTEQLSHILGHFEELSKLETKNVEPLITPTEIESILRPDEQNKIFSAEELLANAPARAGNLFKVPPVV